MASGIDGSGLHLSDGRWAVTPIAIGTRQLGNSPSMGKNAAQGLGGRRRDLKDDRRVIDRDLGPGCITPARCVISGDGSAGTCEIPLGATCG